MCLLQNTPSQWSYNTSGSAAVRIGEEGRSSWCNRNGNEMRGGPSQPGLVTLCSHIKQSVLMAWVITAAGKEVRNTTFNLHNPTVIPASCWCAVGWCTINSKSSSTHHAMPGFVSNYLRTWMLFCLSQRIHYIISVHRLGLFAEIC